MDQVRYKALFVSPHLDDAVFSCAGEIVRLVSEGAVLVVNLFSRQPAEVIQHGMVLGGERLQEEVAVAQFLGYESVNLDELDAPFRHEAYRSVGNLFRTSVVEDSEYLGSLRERFFRYLADVKFDSIYVPLGIGWHVDHVLAHSMFEQWVPVAECYYYEDVPYCLIPHATRYRIDELGEYQCAAIDKSLSPTSGFQAWLQASKAYAGTAMMRNLKPWIVRKCAVPVVSVYLYRLMAQHRRQALITGRHCRLETAMTVTLDGDTLARKLHAMSLYRSQFSEFFRSQQDCAASMIAYAQRMLGESSPVERYWQLKALV